MEKVRILEFETIKDAKTTVRVTEQYHQEGAAWMNALPEKEKNRIIKAVEDVVIAILLEKPVELPENRAELLGWFCVALEASMDGFEISENQQKEKGAPDQGMMNVLPAAVELVGRISEKLGIVRRVPEKGAAPQGVKG
jgi:hypothetical protein